MSFLAIAAGGEDGQEVACLVCYLDFAEWQMVMVHQFTCLGCDDAGGGSTDEGDVGGGGDG